MHNRISEVGFKNLKFRGLKKHLLSDTLEFLKSSFLRLLNVHIGFNFFHNTYVKKNNKKLIYESLGDTESVNGHNFFSV